MKKDFELEFQYQLYLKRVSLKEEKMHPEQKKQLREAFYGACGQMLILLRDDLGALENEEATIVYKNMVQQVSNFFLKSTQN